MPYSLEQYNTYLTKINSGSGEEKINAQFDLGLYLLKNAEHRNHTLEAFNRFSQVADHHPMARYMMNKLERLGLFSSSVNYGVYANSGRADAKEYMQATSLGLQLPWLDIEDHSKLSKFLTSNPREIKENKAESSSVVLDNTIEASLSSCEFFSVNPFVCFSPNPLPYCLKEDAELFETPQNRWVKWKEKNKTLEMVKKSYSRKRYEILKEEAEKGDDEAQYLVGLYYFLNYEFKERLVDSKNTSNNISREEMEEWLQKAIIWLDLSAQQKNPSAYRLLAEIYEAISHSEEKNNKERSKRYLSMAFDYTKLLAERGYVLSMYKLSEMYQKEKNARKAFFWMSRAHKLGDMQAKISLGYMYFDGQVVSKSARKMIKLFSEVDNSCPYFFERMYEVYFNLANHFLNKNNRELNFLMKSYSYFCKAINAFDTFHDFNYNGLSHEEKEYRKDMAEQKRRLSGALRFECVGLLLERNWQALFKFARQEFQFNLLHRNKMILMKEDEFNKIYSPNGNFLDVVFNFYILKIEEIKEREEKKQQEQKSNEEPYPIDELVRFITALCSYTNLIPSLENLESPFVADKILFPQYEFARQERPTIINNELQKTFFSILPKDLVSIIFAYATDNTLEIKSEVKDKKFELDGHVSYLKITDTSRVEENEMLNLFSLVTQLPIEIGINVIRYFKFECQKCLSPCYVSYSFYRKPLSYYSDDGMSCMKLLLDFAKNFFVHFGKPEVKDKDVGWSEKDMEYLRSQKGFQMWQFASISPIIFEIRSLLHSNINNIRGERNEKFIFSFEEVREVAKQRADEPAIAQPTNGRLGVKSLW